MIVVTIALVATKVDRTIAARSMTNATSIQSRSSSLDVSLFLVLLDPSCNHSPVSRDCNMITAVGAHLLARDVPQRLCPNGVHVLSAAAGGAVPVCLVVFPDSIGPAHCFPTLMNQCHSQSAHPRDSSPRHHDLGHPMEDYVLSGSTGWEQF